MRIIWALIAELKLVSLPLVLLCLLYIGVGLLAFITLGDRTDKIGGLSANIFAGALDTFVAVVLINYLIARNQRRQHATSRYAAYHKAQSALRILVLTWTDMVIASAQKLPPLGADLLDDDFMDHVAQHLDLDAPSGVMASSWLSRACAAGTVIKSTMEQITSKYAAALEPDAIVKCIAFEGSILVTSLANLMLASTPFQAQGVTLQRPFHLAFAKSSTQAVRDFTALVHAMAKEFWDQPGFVAPPDFLVTQQSFTGGLSEGLASAYFP